MYVYEKTVFKLTINSHNYFFKLHLNQFSDWNLHKYKRKDIEQVIKTEFYFNFYDLVTLIILTLTKSVKFDCEIRLYHESNLLLHAKYLVLHPYMAQCCRLPFKDFLLRFRMIPVDSVKGILVP